MPEEQGANHSNHNKFFQQLMAEVINRPVDKLAAVVGGDHFNTLWQALFERLQLIFHRRNHIPGIFPGT